MRSENIYVASSWRNLAQPSVVGSLRSQGFKVYDFKEPLPDNNGFHWSEIDNNWKKWDPVEFRQGLQHPIAQAGFKLDMDALKWCDTCLLLLPCGRSAHLELGYAVGAGKKTIVYLNDEKMEPELMYLMCTHICVGWLEVIKCLE